MNICHLAGRTNCFKEKCQREREREGCSILMLSTDQIGCLYFCGCKHTPGMLGFHQAKTRPNRPPVHQPRSSRVCLLIRPTRPFRSSGAGALSVGGGGGGFSNQFNPLRGWKLMKWLSFLKGLHCKHAAPLCVCKSPFPRKPPAHTMSRPVCF